MWKEFRLSLAPIDQTTRVYDISPLNFDIEVRLGRPNSEFLTAHWVSPKNRFDSNDNWMSKKLFLVEASTNQIFCYVGVGFGTTEPMTRHLGGRTRATSIYEMMGLNYSPNPRGIARMNPRTGEIIERVYRDYPTMLTEFTGVGGFHTRFGLPNPSVGTAEEDTSNGTLTIPGFGLGIGRKLALVVDEKDVIVIDIEKRVETRRVSYSQLYSYWAETIEHSWIALVLDGELIVSDLHTGEETKWGRTETLDGIVYSGSRIEFLPRHGVIGERDVGRRVLESYLTIQFWSRPAHRPPVIIFLTEGSRDLNERIESMRSSHRHNLISLGAGAAAVEATSEQPWKVGIVDTQTYQTVLGFGVPEWFVPGPDGNGWNHEVTAPLLFGDCLVLEGESYLLGFPFSPKKA